VTGRRVIFDDLQNRWDDATAATLADELGELIYLSNLVGSDPTLTQPGGGNSSVKRREVDFAGRPVDVLRVKGSGTDLRTIGASGFAGLRRDDLAELRRRERMTDEEMMAFMRASMLDAREPAPSVETPLHSVLPYRFIVHTHDFATQALTDTPRPRELVAEALGDEVAYIDYVRPGFPLARAVVELGPPPPAARGLVLGRHGLIAWGETAKGCYENLMALITRAEAFVAKRRGARPFVEEGPAGLTPAERQARARVVLPILRASLSRGKQPSSSPISSPILHLDDSREALAFVGGSRVAELAAHGMSTPEHILRCGRLPLVLPGDAPLGRVSEAMAVIGAAMARYEAAHVAAYERHRAVAGETMLDPSPRVVLVPGLGLVTAMKDKASALVGNLCYRHVMRVMEAAEALGGFRFLDEADAVEFEYWPLELAKLNAPERELSRQVALVTGAASGIGRAIAERFVMEGAHVVLTDLDGAALRETTAALTKACRDPHRVVAVEADATSAADAARAVTDAVMAFGGLDILVCNAGFLQAGPVDQIDEQAFARHFTVNVEGTFLAVREAVGVMKAAGRGVILLNASKGAFAPTADNAAYASSKAAVAALARNLATELGPHGIRVNYINADFVDTPLMRRLISQRAALRGIDEAEQTAEYRRRNVLRVGPIPPAAVAEAALFLVSARSRYTTGSLITVDGGIKEAMPR
jgi:rhamnulose-1-phosphate aldolase/alcohol dehydrogenase